MFTFFRERPRLLLAALVSGAGVTLSAGVLVQLLGTTDQTPQASTELARDLLDSGRPAAAMDVLRRSDESAEVRLPLEIEATTARRDVFALASLYDLHPEEVAEQEDASQIVARTALMAGETDTVDELTKQWEGRSDQPHAWLCMKADRHLRAGDFAAAREVLESTHFEGDRDAGRQLRLAMLEAADDPIVALDRLNALLRTAPRSGDAHLMRAQLLEGLERLPEARVAYVTALAAVPENPFFRYELASFYRRRGNLQFALRTWEDSLVLASPAPGWLKTLFWSRVAHPTEQQLGDDVNLQGSIATLVEYLAALPDDRFFDDEAFLAMPSAHAYERRYQELFWLQLLEELRVGNEADALVRLQATRFREVSWNMLLEDALASLLRFRTEGELETRTRWSFGGRGPASVHPFIAALHPEEGADLDPDFARFLRSDGAISMTLLACGWMEAALRMPHPAVCLDDAPHHMAFAMTQAYRTNRPSEDAFRFAVAQPQSPAIDTTIGELHLARGEADEAMQMWRLAATDRGPAGYRASWMLAIELLGRKRLTESERVVSAHPDLAASTIGQELLARIALTRGDVAAAIEIYEGIAADSIDARLFAIERRLARGTVEDIREATAIGEQLFEVHPDIPQVRRLVLQLSDLNRSRSESSTQTL